MTPPEIDAYLAGGADDAQRAALERHAGECERCRSLITDHIATSVESIRRGIDATFADHPVFEELSAYVERELDPITREMVDAHLDGCDACAADVAGLQSVRAELHAKPTLRPAARTDRWRTRWVPAAAAAVVLIGIGLIGARIWRADRKAPIARADHEATSVGQSGTGAPGAPSVTLADGPHRITIDGNGRIAGLEHLAPVDRDAVTTALSSGRLPMAPELSQLRVDAGPLMGAAERSRLTALAPIAVVVASDRPTFRWTEMPEARDYRVAVLDARLHLAADSGPLHATDWTPGEALRRNTVYSWQVTATTASGAVIAPTPPSPEARFKILDRDTAERLQQARARYGDSRLILGVLDAQAGLLEEADAELRAFANQNPGSPIAAALLAQARPLRRH